jgi:ribosomal protein L37E
MATYLQKITFGEMRAMGVRGVLVYFANRCGHHTEVSADGWSDDVRLSDIEPKFVCTRCGRRGAEIRPGFCTARMGTG